MSFGVCPSTKTGVETAGGHCLLTTAAICAHAALHAAGPFRSVPSLQPSSSRVKAILLGSALVDAPARAVVRKSSQRASASRSIGALLGRVMLTSFRMTALVPGRSQGCGGVGRVGASAAALPRLQLRAA